MPPNHALAAEALSMSSPTDSDRTSSPDSARGTSWAPRPGRITPSRRLSSRVGHYTAPPTSTPDSFPARILQHLETISRQAWILFLRLPRIQQAAVVVAVVTVPIVSILFLIYSHAIFTWLGPIAKAWRNLPGGWLIIWFMAFFSAFPPLFGYSTAMTLSGMVYGFPLGWPIAASATVVGSTCAFIASRGVLSRYVHNLVGKDRRFVALGQVLRRDGLLVLTGVRFCPLPYSLSNGFLATIPSITTANFAMATAFVSPKLLIHVFIGHRLGLLIEEGDTMSTSDKLINYAGMAAGGLVGTIVGLVVYRRTMARAAELARQENGGEDGMGGDDYVDGDAENSRLMSAVLDETDAAALMDDDDISLWGDHDYEPDQRRVSDEDAETRGNGVKTANGATDGSTNHTGQYLITQFSFEVPLDYKVTDGPKLMLYASSVTKNDRPIVHQTYHPQQRPWMVYNEGGPGYGNSEPESMPLTKAALSRGYQVLYLDYRGTGLSTPVTARLLESKGDAQKQADYLKLFRQDNIVRDLEAVRKALTVDYPEELRQWSIFGHSFGGFVSLTYLSFFPESLREVFISGGLAPIGRTADEVYEATYRKLVERNKAYFNKFPEDKQLLAEIAAFLASNPGASVQLPAGGTLTFPRLLTMGLNFGSHGGLDAVHSLLVRITSDLGQVGYISYPTLALIEKALPFDVAPIYAILHEAIYCDGNSSNWAAQRLGEAAEGFAWLSSASDPVAFTQQVAGASGTGVDQQPLFRFSGEMIYKMHFETHPELRRMREAADILARFDGWDKLYDEAQLARNEVPVYATSYVEDMYVDSGFARETAAKVRGTKVFETNVLYHNAIRARSDEVFAQLWRLRDDPID